MNNRFYWVDEETLVILEMMRKLGFIKEINVVAEALGAGMSNIRIYT